MKTLQSVTLVNGPVEHLAYLSAILSSLLINFWCVNYLADDMNQSYLSRVPIVPPTKCDEKKIQNLSRLVDSISIFKQTKPNTPLDANQLNRAIAAADISIDREVYALYNLTDEEIRIIELFS